LRLIALCLLSFTVQSALASAHLHISAYGRSTNGVASALFTTDLGSTAGQSDLAKRTSSTGDGNCPLCQFLMLGGAALHTALSAALAPVESPSFVVADQTFAHFVAAVSYSWQGRGPPN
jgi:hypothetical protein